MRVKLTRLLVLSLLVLPIVNKSAHGQLEFPEDKVHWSFSVEQNGEEAYVVGKITMEEHWHIYAANLPEGAFSIPTEIKLNGSSSFKAIGEVIEPKPIHEHDEIADEELYYHSNTVILKRKIKVLSEDDFEITGEFSFQTCDDDHCLPPHSATFKVKVKGVTKSDRNKLLFENAKGDEVTDEDGVVYVKVNDEWHPVPEGNSVRFYKKYIALRGKDEK